MTQTPVAHDAGVVTQPAQHAPDAGNVVTPTVDGGVMPAPGAKFDAGSDPNRNHVQAGMICTRLAQIQCAGEAFCCANPGRDRSACETAERDFCTQQVYLDAISQSAVSGFDATLAASAFEQFEQKAAACDTSIAQFGESNAGLRGMMRGTLKAGANCAPGITVDNAAAAAALASCTDGETQACLPKDPLVWLCSPKSAADAACFTDVNCQEGLYCPNPNLEIGTKKCTARKAPGASCMLPNECASLYCKGGMCVEATVEAAYCLGTK